MPKSLPNGDIQSNGMMGGPKPQPKKILPPFHDTRSDLMKAIRDGKFEYCNLTFWKIMKNICIKF